MIKALAWVHRWTGGIIGLLLALIGLTGTFLLWKGAWIALTVPVAGNAYTNDPAQLASVTQQIIEHSDRQVKYIRFANDDVPVHTVNTGPESGFYADASGTALASWSSIWDRAEVALFDFHHYLLMGDTGKTLAGIAALFGLGFVITGLILWWPTRKTFKFRLWPARMTRPAIIRQHRDLGVVLAPFLFFTMLTGAMMTLPPVSAVLLSPFSSPAEMEAAAAKPEIMSGPADNARWDLIMTRAQERFPGAVVRIASFPRKEGDPVTIRLKQPGEWHNNGRTMVWFDGRTSEIIGTVDALALPQGSKLSNLVYPLHAAKVGGIIYKIVQTFTGLTLALLGTFAVWSFWFRRTATPTKAKRSTAAIYRQ
ncbi:PepSY-associated TM helix domain-containing protein [Parasphingorhabdus sp.]|uniref:PepSY-associated TM helix domain-containing protein n=1 Tax=Parasphingorhabdus sp. TaxID=2709688 RepID=UPI002F95B988